MNTHRSLILAIVSVIAGLLVCFLVLMANCVLFHDHFAAGREYMETVHARNVRQAELTKTLNNNGHGLIHTLWSPSSLMSDILIMDALNKDSRCWVARTIDVATPALAGIPVPIILATFMLSKSIRSRKRVP